MCVILHRVCRENRCKWAFVSILGKGDTFRGTLRSSASMSSGSASSSRTYQSLFKILFGRSSNIKSNMVIYRGLERSRSGRMLQPGDRTCSAPHSSAGSILPQCVCAPVILASVSRLGACRSSSGATRCHDMPHVRDAADVVRSCPSQDSMLKPILRIYPCKPAHREAALSEHQCNTKWHS